MRGRRKHPGQPSSRRAHQKGDAADERRLLLVYEQLRNLARWHLAREWRADRSSTTSLIHEAYVRLGGQSVLWDDQAAYLKDASRAMWRLLVDQARRRQAEKRGGGRPPASLATIDPAAPSWEPEQVLRIEEALAKLSAALDETGCDLFRLRCIAGLNGVQAAGVLGLSTPVVSRKWKEVCAFISTFRADAGG